MDDTKSIGERFRAEVEKRYKTQREFAEAMSRIAGKEIFEQSVSDYLRGRFRPGKIMLKRLEDMGFDVGYIMTGRRADETASSLVKGEKLVELKIPTNAARIIHEISLEGGNIYIAVYSALVTAE